MKFFIVRSALEMLEFANAMISGLVVVTFHLLESLIVAGMALTRFRRNRRARSIAGVAVSRDRLLQPSQSASRYRRSYRVAA